MFKGVGSTKSNFIDVKAVKAVKSKKNIEPAKSLFEDILDNKNQISKNYHPTVLSKRKRFKYKRGNLKPVNDLGIVIRDRDEDVEGLSEDSSDGDKDVF